LGDVVQKAGELFSLGTLPLHRPLDRASWISRGMSPHTSIAARPRRLAKRSCPCPSAISILPVRFVLDENPHGSAMFQCHPCERRDVEYRNLRRGHKIGEGPADARSAGHSLLGRAADDQIAAQDGRKGNPRRPRQVILKTPTNTSSGSIRCSRSSTSSPLGPGHRRHHQAGRRGGRRDLRQGRPGCRQGREGTRTKSCASSRPI
jgi:hypothetical protein